MKLRIFDHANTSACETSAEDFLIDNADDDALVPLVARLRLGESFTIGGGAAPAFTITRIADWAAQ